jgi:hypothetical protein
MQDNPPQDDDLKAKWWKIYLDILSASGKTGVVMCGGEFDSHENSADLSEFDCDPNHSQTALLIGDDPPQDEPDESNDENSDASGNIKTWDVDLAEFLKDVEDDPNAATMLSTANEFDLDAGLENDIIEDAFYSKNSPDDDDMFWDANPEQDSLRENPLDADLSSYTSYDEFDETPCKSYIKKFWENAWFPIVIIFLIILISMILYVYVCWIKSMMH